MRSSIKAGLIGVGTIGTGVIKVLERNSDIIRRRAGIDIKLKWVCDIDLERERDVDISKYKITRDFKDVLNDPEVDIIIELVGGTTVAKDIILGAIERKKHVVTANKALLAEFGKEIFEKAQNHQVDVGFEASVAGGIPIIKALKEGLCANKIKKIYGIVNGTANYILTQMETRHMEFEAALMEAQRNGYAEADPSLDIDGIDAAHKTAILATLATGRFFSVEDVYVEGIREIAYHDILFARDFGYKIKLLSIIKLTNSQIELRVHPTLVPEYHPLAKVENAFNAVVVIGDVVGPTMFYGIGAGEMPTASAVVADVMDIARDIAKGVYQRVAIITDDRKLEVKPIGELECKYYIRFSAVDKPGVLSKISGILAKYSISIESVIQKGRRKKGFVPVVMMTHKAKESAVKNAIEEIDKLDVVERRSVVIRVEENNSEF